MNGKPDLRTPEGVLEWAGKQTIWHANRELDVQTATYIAECMRLEPIYHKVLTDMNCKFRLDGTVKSRPFRDEKREAENERLRQAFEDGPDASRFSTIEGDHAVLEYCVELRNALKGNGT